MIECHPQTLILIDERVINSCSSVRYNLKFNEIYLKELPKFHGGVPIAPYFTDSNGEIRRIGWFVSILDENKTNNDNNIYNHAKSVSDWLRYFYSLLKS